MDYSMDMKLMMIKIARTYHQDTSPVCDENGEMVPNSAPYQKGELEPTYTKITKVDLFDIMLQTLEQVEFNDRRSETTLARQPTRKSKRLEEKRKAGKGTKVKKPIAKKRSRSRLDNPVQQECPACRLSLPNLQSYKQHLIATHLMFLGVSCLFCRKTFATPYKLSCHLRHFHEDETQLEEDLGQNSGGI